MLFPIEMENWMSNFLAAGFMFLNVITAIFSLINPLFAKFRLGEAKASGNLGNTLKVMGKFEEAVICCRRHLEICQEHRDRVGEGRALYNLGNVYHAKVI